MNGRRTGDTEEYDSAAMELFPRFEIKAFYVNMISAASRADPTLGLYPSILLYDNEKGNPAGRIHAVAYFHNDCTTMDPPSFRDNVIYLHYPMAMLDPLLRCLQSGVPLRCYLRGHGTATFGGIQGGPCGS